METVGVGYSFQCSHDTWEGGETSEILNHHSSDYELAGCFPYIYVFTTVRIYLQNSAPCPYQVLILVTLRVSLDCEQTP